MRTSIAVGSCAGATNNACRSATFVSPATSGSEPSFPRALAVEVLKEAGIELSRYRVWGPEQCRQRPDQGIEPVRGRHAGERFPAAQLVFEGLIGPDMVDSPLLVERRNRFSPGTFAYRRVDRLERQGLPHRGQGVGHQIATLVRFVNDTIGLLLIEALDGAPSPLVRAIAPAAVSQHIAVAIPSTASHDDARLVGFFPCSHSGINGHHNAEEVGRRRYPPNHGPFPQGALRFLEEHRKKFLLA